MARYRGRHKAARKTADAEGRAGGRRLRRGMTGTAIAAAAMTALTASQAPGLELGRQSLDESGKERAGETRGGESPGDDSYHTELPPLESPAPPKTSPDVPEPGPSESGIPATVLAAYKKAAQSLSASDPGCGLRWELLAAIGKVESGQARGGAVDKEGTTLRPILGPVLNGSGFARIHDTDGGRHDGDAKYDRAVGPMQFIPSTWSRWGVDGNGDGASDPNNIYDAALSAGEYLCAGGKELTVKADLDRAVLSYNHSQDYLRTVLAWYEFYRNGTHEVPDGKGALPTSPGAGGDSGKSAGPGKGEGHGKGPGKGGSGEDKPGKGDGGTGGENGDGDDGDHEDGDDPSPSPTPSTPDQLTPQGATTMSAGAGRDFAERFQVKILDEKGKPAEDVRVKYEIAGETGANFRGATTVTTDSSGIATAPALNAGDAAGQFTVKATVVDHEHLTASFTAGVEPRADRLVSSAGSVTAGPDSHFQEQIEVTASFKGKAVADLPMDVALLDAAGKPAASGPRLNLLGDPVRSLTDRKTGRDGLLGLFSKEGVLKLPTIYTDKTKGDFILRVTAPDGPSLDIKLTVK